MADTSKVAKNLRAFQMAVNAHDRENPTHTAWGIGLAAFDMERLGFDEGEEVLPGIVIQADGGVTGNFRVLCDGDHDAEREAEEADVVEAVSSQELVGPIAPAGPRRDQAAGRCAQAEIPVPPPEPGPEVPDPRPPTPGPAPEPQPLGPQV